MITLRVIALKDEPNQALLSQLARFSCRLFKTHDSGPFYLDVPSGSEGQYPEFGDFHGAFAHDPDKIDFSFLDTFKSKHQNRLRDVTLHKDIITDAVYLSSVFQTRVLSGYSNDEGDDWAVVAENGRLLRLRFRAEQEVTGDVSPERLRKSKTEIHATRVLPEPNEADSDNAYEYTVCEAIKTEGAELSFQPFWRFFRLHF